MARNAQLNHLQLLAWDKEGFDQANVTHVLIWYRQKSEDKHNISPSFVFPLCHYLLLPLQFSVLSPHPAPLGLPSAVSLIFCFSFFLLLIFPLDHTIYWCRVRVYVFKI